MKYWTIEVNNWGTLFAKGTEEQAEEWRKAKANWEHSIARKREATQEEIKSNEFSNLEDLL